MQSTIHQPTPSRWRRFSRAAYAAFVSLHREVQIGVLSVSMLGVVGLKAHASATAGDLQSAAGASASAGAGEASGPAGPGGAAEAEVDQLTPTWIDDVTVVASRTPIDHGRAARLVTILTADEIAASPARSINDLLDYAVGVDVRQRGELGVQTDISVRGGNFDQVTILLNGFNISSPHTGHLSADFPVALHDIERIEVVEGPAARTGGTCAFTGVINIVTRGSSGASQASADGVPARSSIRPQRGDVGRLTLAGGSYGYGGADLTLSPLAGHYVSGGFSRADGATPHSAFRSTRFFYQGHADLSPRLRLEGQAGYSYKPYDANTFYGASNDLQWESNERIMTALRAEATLGHVRLTPSVYWNRWFDHYQWWKDVSPAGENFHQVDTWGGGLTAEVSSRLGRTSVAVDARHEGIWSTSLGHTLEPGEERATGGRDADPAIRYTRHDCRTEVVATAEHIVLLRHWTLAMGLISCLQTGLDTRVRCYPGVDVAYRTDGWGTLFASWNMALRMPTFTDLYYSGANIEGNSDLRPERTRDATVGWRHQRRGWRAQATAFYSHKSNMIDWVIDAAATDGIFRSVNFRSDHVGAELSATMLPRELWPACPVGRVGVQYAYLDEHSHYDRPIASSKYAMDYLRHKLVCQAESRLWSRLSVGLTWRVQDRVRMSGGSYGLLDGRLAWDAAPARRSGLSWSLWAECTNLLDRAYCDYVSIPQPGRWGKVGFACRF